MWFFSKSNSKAGALPFAWTPRDHATGHEPMDEDHRQLAALVTEVEAIIAARGDRNEAYRVMDLLVQTARDHFQREEAFMAEAGYGGLERHAAQHAELLATCQDLLRQFKNGTLSGLALPTFLKNWLVPHIQGCDRQFVQELRKVPGRLPLG
ncbi:bacteriohemerythrin [Mesoterricola sediminis]|uniref:Hemerythrin-like domain-containing protein n=1 Tax=Mesoterricola sediminis TaxID=2927980 RepID=A0AA48KGD7_9BACT|nr:bacteriohemerythrin [Mesoterricola sediminis]BDU77333.1 hypothetical protein METESE_22910 [Mesoterricola sediminis]